MSVQIKSDNSSDELRVDSVSKGARVTLYDFTSGNPVTPATDASVTSVLAALVARLGVLGQAAMAASTPVTIASNQSSIPVAAAQTGSWTVTANAGSGTFTVSGTVTANAGTNLNTSALALDATTAGIMTSLGTDGVTPPSIPGTGVRGWLRSIYDQLHTTGIAVTGTVSVSNFPATQPVSATTLPLPTGAATETTLSTRLADSTFTTRINTLGQKVMASSTPVTVASDQSALAVTGTFFQTTQPISGTIIANAGTGSFTIAQATAANLNATVTGTVTTNQGGSWTVTSNIGTTNGLALDATLTGGTQTTRITDGTNTTTVKAASTAAIASDKALVVAVSPNNSVAVTGTFFQGTQPVSGSVSVSNFPGTQAVTGTFFQVTQPVSIAATVTTQGLGIAGTPSGGVASVQGVSGGTAVPISGSVSVSNFPATQAVSGTVGVSGSVAVTGTFFQVTQPVSATSLPLPTGASTETTLGTRLADSTFTMRVNTQGQKAMAASTPVVLASDQSSLPVTGTFFQATQPVSGTTTGNQGVPNTAANGWPVKVTDGTNTLTMDGDGAANVSIQGSTTAAVTSVPGSGTNVTLLTSNSGRDMASFYNNSTSYAYLKMGATASTSSFSVKISPSGLYELPVPAYAGQVDCIWDTANGAMLITEQQ